MKKLFKIFAVCGLVITATSCNKYLDVNTNPNAPTKDVTPDIILPQALVSTGAYSVQFNTYGGYTDGMIANAGGFGAFGSQTTYNFATTDYTNLFSNSYDNLNDYQYIIDNTTADGTQRYYNAAARIMKAFAYQRLVDTYGDVPYTDALKGAANTTPKYDKAEAIYTDLFVQLNTAITSIDLATAETPTSIGSGPSGKPDPLFGGDMAKWKAFANTIKLRMLIRIQGVSSLSSVFTTEKAKIAGAAFLDEDAVVQPGYTAGVGGKQNPMWNTWAWNETGTATGTGIAQEPTFYAVGFYDGKKIQDNNRGLVTYKSLTSATGQLGSSTNPNAPNGSAWFSGPGSTNTGITAHGAGILKGPAMAQPIMLKAESKFLQAEGALIGLLPGGDYTTPFNDGIRASFRYLYKDQNGTFSEVYGAKALTEAASATDANAYIALASTNPTTKSYLVKIGDATSNAQRLEAIITQKWIALNMITGDEAYNEYRRTGFPVSVAGTTATTAASTLSVATTADKLPVRIQYPSTEYALNSANVPAAVNNFTSKLFWDLN